MTQSLKILTCRWVSSHNFGGLMSCNNIIGVPIFKVSACEGKPGRFMALRNYTGKLITSYSFTTVSTDR